MMKIPMAVSFPWQRCTTVQPSSLAKHPETWTKEEVGVWLRWCSEEYSIEPVPQNKFDLNGRALCLLSRNDFMERAPKNGDVLYNSLKSLMSKFGKRSQTPVSTTTATEWYSQLSEPHKPCITSCVMSDQSPARYLLMPSSSPSTSVAKLPSNMPYIPRSPSYVPIQPHPYVSPPTKQADDHELSSLFGRPHSDVVSGSSPFIRPSSAPEAFRSEHASRQDRTTDCRLLWEFIYQLLCNTQYSSLVCWEDKDEFVFRIINPTGLAELWGQQKNRTNMTYEKLSRALRYYYRMNIIKKVPGKRLTYRFLQPPTTIQKGQRGAKPHYKIHMETRDARRTGMISRAESAIFSGNSSSETEAGLSRMWASEMVDVFKKDDDTSKADSSDFEDDVTVHESDIESHVESTNYESDVSSIKCEASSDIEQKVPVLQTYPPNISFSHSTLEDKSRLNNTDIPLQSSFYPESRGSDRSFQTRESMIPPASTSYHRRSERETEFDIKNRTHRAEMDLPSQNYISKNFRPSGIFPRSRSLDFAQTFQAQSYCIRPYTSVSSADTASQLEPEDLSIKERPPRQHVPSDKSLKKEQSNTDSDSPENGAEEKK
ncbi:ETS variant 7 [Mactra antiquata]